MKYFFSILFFLFSLLSYSETQPIQYKFRVYLTDKGDTGYSVDNPSEFLTENAIERKRVQKVAIDESDFPISNDYFALVEMAGGKVVSHSKWFNTLVVEVADSLKIEDIKSLSIVDSVKYLWRGTANSYRKATRPRLERFRPEKEPADSVYGYTYPQFTLHNADEMLNAGYIGNGIQIGVIDAGFTNFDVIPEFESVKLLGYSNFVPEGDMFASSDHGTKVLSTMAVCQPGMMIGSAPEASYWLLRSEDVISEYPVEEDYWIRAVEFADSLGLDLINSSLGYNEFDDIILNYTHDDLTGGVSLMSRAADMAYDKGMIIVVSAGNEGNKPWQKSTPPGDAKNVIAVGAVGTDSIIAPFSSHGEMADGRIKPDLVSVGRNTVTINQFGVIGTTNGTSLSSPFLAGLIASLWSINPELHRTELIDIIFRSSDRNQSPDPVYGHGITDFSKAMNEVLKIIE
ncbi:MAG: S8 family serine peptidase [Fermentimonas sp.]|nr:S8 family serine peptidase [Fermentimonas sp.]